ncbi:teichoic acid transporter [Virgibacillus halodenitrificans]|uniref:Teichoic acid transporter n=1 Tax=Virgibacillus halodenitrificans TaxID=1482 RepID=A0AAC9NM30_VIRHA|nr:oligosaccharide flippase family protein [Virgibacillus halodenitrificans]APC49613.1 teichoic acid transporter [Virgibacillus halodenitrificans]
MNQIKQGAILSYLSIFITILIALLYTPVIIRLLGQSEYGLYSLIGSVAAYFSILDLGLGNTIVRYTSRNRAIGDKKAESNLNGMFLLLYSFIGFLTIVIGIIIYNTIDNIFAASLSTSELYKAKIMIVILIINFALSFPLAVFGSIMQAYERFVVVKLVAIVRSLMAPIIILPILFLGYGSVSMVLITTLVNISCLLFNVFYCLKHLKIKFYIGKMDFRLLKEILGYSFFVFLGVIVDQINWNTDQFILGAIAGTVPVAVYAIAMQFIKLYKQFSTSISGLFLPRASIMVANNSSNEEITESMIKYGRIQYIIMAYILTGFILFGRPFINVWAGTNYDNAYYISLIIMIPLTIPLFQNFGISILYAKNLQKFRSVVLIFIAVLNIFITIPLVQKFGGIGAAVGTAISLTLGNIFIMNIYYHRRIGINMILFWKNILIMSFPVIISLLIGLGFNYIVTSGSILLLSSKIIIYSVIFIILMWLLGLNNYEKELFSTTVIKIRNKVVRRYG